MAEVPWLLLADQGRPDDSEPDADGLSQRSLFCRYAEGPLGILPACWREAGSWVGRKLDVTGSSEEKPCDDGGGRRWKSSRDECELPRPRSADDDGPWGGGLNERGEDPRGLPQFEPTGWDGY